MSVDPWSSDALARRNQLAGEALAEGATPNLPPKSTTSWRTAPDCDRCRDTGRFQERNMDAPCGCKRGRRMSELWYAEKHGLPHPDMPEPSEPDWDDAPF